MGLIIFQVTKMSIKSILTTAVILFIAFSCKEDIVQSNDVLTAVTDKSVYTSGQQITVQIKNFTNKTVYLNQCGENLYPTLIRIDSSSSGGGSFTVVCRQLKNLELRSSESVSDTLSFLLTGRYKLKFLYDYEDIMPELCREEFYSNEFDIQ